MTKVELKTVLEVVSGECLQGDCSGEVTGVSINSKDLHPGDLFVAFVGQTVDGHQYVGDALKAGAIAALVTSPGSIEPASGNIIQVTDTLQAIQDLARHERKEFTGPVIGVTGSNGKTTTKDMLRQIFDEQGQCLATKGNFNNELGMPLTILRRDPSDTAMVLEMGMRGQGEIAALCEIAKPTAAMITNIGHSHLERLGSQENIAKAKSELLQALPADGIAVLNHDDPWQRQMANWTNAQVYWYGQEEMTHAHAKNIHAKSTGYTFEAHIMGKTQVVNLPILGQHNVTNALGAMLIGALHEIPLPTMAKALTGLTNDPGRLHLRHTESGHIIIDDCYNASPLSMAASLQVLTQLADATHLAVAVLGDMYELGVDEADLHRQVGQTVATLGIPYLITIGEKAEWIAEGAGIQSSVNIHHFENKSEAVKHLPTLIPKAAVILVKASRGMQLEHIVQALMQM